ncbi:hypothetical protein [Granulicella sp. 5B5]|uniref:hypothetical protein n=1 Tax=Granulicella sp. 5B5 TaxID=1617967 RepID=UPI0015F4203C|nr:hypothetical protein [Granulicella sp. 5B5]
MKKFLFALTAAFALTFILPAPKADAQVSFGINIGEPPVCPYGYYGYAPYNCAPYGYYSDDWFDNGVFIGAGRWYHGPAHFYGHVNRSFDPRYGYHGGYPAHGGYHEPADHFQSFHATHRADPRGNYRADDHTHGTANDRGARGGGGHGH